MSAYPPYLLPCSTYSSEHYLRGTYACYVWEGYITAHEAYGTHTMDAVHDIYKTHVRKKHAPNLASSPCAQRGSPCGPNAPHACLRWSQWAPSALTESPSRHWSHSGQRPRRPPLVVSVLLVMTAAIIWATVTIISTPSTMARSMHLRLPSWVPQRKTAEMGPCRRSIWC